MNEQIAARVREERKRLGFASQGLLAERLGISPSSVHNYEAGKRLPESEFLLKFVELGGDMLYVMTGNRSVGVVTDEEAKLLEVFRRTPEVVRQAVMAALAVGVGSTVPGAEPGHEVEQALPAEKEFTPQEREALERKAGIQSRIQSGIRKRSTKG